ncbi:MAG: GNAT family N-acetyltransferase [Pseudomonadales bacterium]|nr:GNAT family N-acetyltransferase [Pseudomonadales bacterium]MBO6564366.1 GNAT family N-acetyltransferase [Pseudomonadales bacterium]MBO6595449.1 GNAT family N-acetyltransferase [Pseudomonadales bacterium]MBO6657548.1 GNAT family N-acetyltransferase [Pseudomonadales bacterium]MBO6701949.1 GNAT family N-acetyltransferase [Pseudomonadales bacterium]
MKNLTIRSATPSDLDKINLVIESAVLNWPLPNRVKRLAVPVLRYTETDLDFFETLVATFKDEVIGVAAWDAAPAQSLPNGQGGLFHGLYVLPLIQGQGVGEALMEAVFSDARALKTRGLLIKAQRVSRNFFEHHRMQPLAANDNEFPWQYWKRLA